MSCSSPPHPCDYTSGCHDRICCRYMRRSDGLGRDRHHGKGYSNAPALLKYQRVIHPDLPASLITALMCRHHPRQVPTIPTRRSPCANTRSHTSHLESLLGPWHTTVRLGIRRMGRGRCRISKARLEGLLTTSSVPTFSLVRSPCLRCVSDAAGVFAALKLCLKLTSAGTLTYLITTNLKMSLGLR
ncbi:uncharacterized protein LOC135089709 isoform X3 [Scylla paramamosain]|uniref:uncharacterized protein LOC135089709 isoform X3 n=1 Tax=Scylla paramamosain TaxID=85552 RepID=UPI0030827D58